MIAPTVSTAPVRKSSLAPEKKYKCQFCNRAFSRSEHRSRHERSRKLIHVPDIRFSLFWGRKSISFALLHLGCHTDTSLQTPRNAHSNASNVEVLSFDAIFFSDTIGLYMQKTEVFLCTATLRGGRRHPSQQSPSTHLPSNRLKPAAMGWLISKQLQC
jgi:uncharacterized Zn-finger protein